MYDAATQMKPLWICLLLSWAAAPAPRLIPFPKEIEPRPGAFALDRQLVLEAEPALAPLLARRIAEELALARLSPPPVRAALGGGRLVRLHAGKPGDPPRLSFRSGATEEDYVLRVEPDAIALGAPGDAGLFHGLETLCQLIRANREGNALPCLAIRDWPSIRWRAFQDDLTRGPSTRLEQLKGEVSLGAYFKLNVFTYYMEYQYAFR
jgi:hexosaminidase